MPQDSFHNECDRISQGVDGVQYERQRWAKTEGPMLAKLVELAHAAIADRDDFELTEEGASTDIKRFVLKVHSFRVVGVVMWLGERRRNQAQFGGTAAHGIGAGLWWSAVTMTTVGYGDKAPVTILGRLLGLVWMFAAIIIISSFTAAIA